MEANNKATHEHERRQSLFIGINNALDFLSDIIKGATFGDLDDSDSGEEGRQVGLSQIEMVRLAVAALHDNSEGGAK